MNQREVIQEYLKSIAPARLKPKDLAEILGMNANSCAVVLSSLANTEGSGVHHERALGYKFDAPSMDHLELQEMYWHNRAVKAERECAAAEAVAYQALTKVDKQELRIKYQHEALVALQKLQDLDNDTKE